MLTYTYIYMHILNLYIFMHVYAYMRTHIQTHTHITATTKLDTYAYITHTWNIHTYIHKHMYTVYMYLHTNIYAYLLYIYTNKQTLICISIYFYIWRNKTFSSSKKKNKKILFLSITSFVIFWVIKQNFKRKTMTKNSTIFSRNKHFQRKSNKVYLFGRVGTHKSRDTETFEVRFVSKIGTELNEWTS